MISERSLSLPKVGTWRQRTVSLALVLGLLASAGCENEPPPPPGGRKAIAIEALPEVVREAATKALPDIKKLDEAWENLDEARKVQSYEIKGHNAKGKIREVRIGLDGKVLEVE